MSTETRNLFIIEHTYYDFITSTLSKKGSRKLKYITNLIKSCLGKKKVSIFFEPRNLWIHKSATLMAKSFATVAVESLNLDSYGNSRNAKKMLGLLNNKNNEENVVLITSNSGVMDLIRELKKSCPESESFYLTTASELNGLKKIRLSFVGIPNKRIRKEMDNIPSSNETNLIAKISIKKSVA